LIYVITGQKNTDKTFTKSNERKLLWDEENRLLALSDNGFVSNYWYDAAGERTVKESGVGQGVSVNGLLSGGITGTTNFTAYISPYLVLNNGGYYTKHIYMGSQRIVSKLGSSDIFTIRNPLTDTTANKQNFVPKLTDLTGKIKVRYDSLGVVYNGTSQGSAGLITSPSGRIGGALLYYFHSDHLGSSSLITDATGGIVQHLEYIPFGEVFIDERAATSTWSTLYKFNAKELDEETGLYYYGARYYDPRTSVWISVDPLAEKYPNMSSYVYCEDNPVVLIDPDGMKPHPYPLSLLGNSTYYNWRLRDYLRQNPGASYPNSYYIGYGSKYIQRFTNETAKTLSSAGKKWLSEVRKDLQIALEDRLSKGDGESFEKDNKGFTKFAFDSHIDAYWNNGSGHTSLYSLPVLDLVKIVLTPDAKDLISENGRSQVLAISEKFLGYFAGNPEQLKQKLNEAWDNRSQILKLIEKKAQKEHVPVEQLKQALSPLIPIHKPE
jgi:RHS repeat-associated protein